MTLSFQSAKGANGERDMLEALLKAGHSKAYRVGHQQRIPGPKPPDIEGTEFYAENKDRANIPIQIWTHLFECLQNRPKTDLRPPLLRLKRTGKKYPPVIVMFEKDWVDRERRLLQMLEASGRTTSSSRSDVTETSISSVRR